MAAPPGLAEGALQRIRANSAPRGYLIKREIWPAAAGVMALAVIIPPGGGILAAYALLDDPTLELRFATPVGSAQMLFERLAPTFVVQAFFALVYQLFALALGADFSTAFQPGALCSLAGRHGLAGVIGGA